MNKNIATVLTMVIASAIVGAATNLYWLNINEARTVERVAAIEKQMSSLVSQLQNKNALSYKSP